ncbi:MAG: hypothetical protein HY698_16435 [Deltaproteobacteria bacterium]|nr:hypothetical protein [Deltaproteobacteria bacterium]
MPRALRLAIFLAGWAMGSIASADVRLPVSLEVAGCNPSVSKELRRLLEVELGGRLVEANSPALAVLLQVTCLDAGAELVARGPNRTVGRTATSKLEGLAWARLLALASAELLETHDQHEHQEPPPPSASEPRRSRAKRPLHITALATSSLLTRPTMGRFGGGLAVAHAPWSRVGWHLDLIAETGSHQVSSGTVEMDSISSSLAVAIHAEAGHATLTAGLGGRMGAVRFGGTASSAATSIEGRQFWAFWAAPVMSASVRFELPERWSLAAGMEVGWAVRPAVALAGETRAASIDGLIASLVLGVGVRL